ncbi:hypothetical protein IMSHALPRED_004223 [Imshaugia aleurites]|uniref:Uncharacterized protein n=1 Tax=Imshaugia aleurites TaxID=172621 RepID=A0A8H3F4S2_9LECA|nr:hypothetical protein IMSHALPRED_004223 [Imshaugia aleurites]
MKCLIVLATGLASLDFLAAPYAAASESSSPSAVLTLPPQPAGESLSNYLDQLFSNNTGNSSVNTYYAGLKNKRAFTDAVATSSYTDSYGLHQSCWDDDTDSETISYNVSVDFSECGTGLKLDTDIGFYTFTNGTTANNSDLRDIVADLYSLRHSRQTPNPNYANHTATIAQLAMEEANQVLNHGLICQNTSDTAQTEALVHEELRHLLANKHSYWTAVILSAAGGAAVGAVVSSLSDLAFNGNVTAENVVQTAIVIGAVVLIGGILTRCDQVGRLDRAENVVSGIRNTGAQLVPQGREAIVQNVYIGWARRQLQRIARQQVQEALSEAGVESLAGSGAGSVGGSVGGSGASSGAGSVAGSVATSPHTPNSLADTCLSELEAGQAGSAIGEMTDVSLNLEPIQEVIEQLGQRDEQGGCSST